MAYRHATIQLLLINFAVFVAESSRGIVVPTLFQYANSLFQPDDEAGSSLYLGFLVAVFSVGRLVSSLALGYLSSGFGISDGKIVMVTLVCSAISNIAYALVFNLISHTELARALLLASRLMLGFSTGVLGVARAYVSLVTTQQQRTSQMALLNAAQFAGFSITPLLGALLCYVDFKIGGIVVNCLTAPGFFLAFTNILMAIMLFLLYDSEIPTKVNTATEREVLINESEGKVEVDTPTRPWPTLILFMSLNGVVRGAVSVVETLGSKLFVALFAPPSPVIIPPPDSSTSSLGWWSTSGLDDNSKHPLLSTDGYYFATVGAIGIIAYSTIHFVGKKFDKKTADFWMLIIGLASLVLGSLFLLQGTSRAEDATLFHKLRFIAGCICIWSLAQPLTSTSVVSLFSKALPNEKQGAMMGWFTAFGSIGRIILPVIAGLGNQLGGFFTVVVVSGASIIGIWIMRKKLLEEPEEQLTDIEMKEIEVFSHDASETTDEDSTFQADDEDPEQQE